MLTRVRRALVVCGLGLAGCFPEDKPLPAPAPPAPAPAPTPAALTAPDPALVLPAPKRALPPGAKVAWLGLAVGRLGLRTGPLTTAGKNAMWFTKTGASLAKLVIDGVRMIPRPAAKGKTKPPDQPGVALL